MNFPKFFPHIFLGGRGHLNEQDTLSGRGVGYPHCMSSRLRNVPYAGRQIPTKDLKCYKTCVLRCNKCRLSKLANPGSSRVFRSDKRFPKNARCRIRSRYLASFPQVDQRTVILFTFPPSSLPPTADRFDRCPPWVCYSPTVARYSSRELAAAVVFPVPARKMW